MSEIGAQQVEELLHDSPPGSFEWTKDSRGEIAQITFTCPCGCKNISAISVIERMNGEGPAVRDAKWSWNGSQDKPSLFPSLRRLEGCRWHGFLTNGVWSSA